MTSNQLQLQSNLETERHNKAVEDITTKANAQTAFYQNAMAENDRQRTEEQKAYNRWYENYMSSKTQNEQTLATRKQQFDEVMGYYNAQHVKYQDWLDTIGAKARSDLAKENANYYKTMSESELVKREQQWADIAIKNLSVLEEAAKRQETVRHNIAMEENNLLDIRRNAEYNAWMASIQEREVEVKEAHVNSENFRNWTQGLSNITDTLNIFKMGKDFVDKIFGKDSKYPDSDPTQEFKELFGGN